MNKKVKVGQLSEVLSKELQDYANYAADSAINKHINEALHNHDLCLFTRNM